jgi:hypothetical protein
MNMSSRRNIFIAAVVVVAALVAYAFWPNTRSWTEDVQLDDGTVIQIERTVTFETSNSWAGDAPVAIDKRVTLRLTGALADLPAWRVRLIPMVLYQDAQTKEWVIVAETNLCDVWYARGQPFPPYWEYRLTRGQWRAQPLSENSKGRAANLLVTYRSPSLPSHVSLEFKKSISARFKSDDPFMRVVPDIRRFCMATAN